MESEFRVLSARREVKTRMSQRRSCHQNNVVARHRPAMSLSGLSFNSFQLHPARILQHMLHSVSWVPLQGTIEPQLVLPVWNILLVVQQVQQTGGAHMYVCATGLENLDLGKRHRQREMAVMGE